MSEPLFIGVDIGTQGTKAALYTLSGKQIASGFEPSVLYRPQDGAVEQNPDEMLGSVLRTVSDVIQKSKINPKDVGAVGIDAQMAGILAVDKDYNAVTPYDSWLDTRCAPYIDVMKNQAEEHIIKTTGGQVSFAHGPKLLWWKNERPETYKKIAKFILPSAYVTGKMCGLTAEEAYIDDTHIHFSGFGDIINRKWDSNLLADFSIDENKLPKMVRPSQLVGSLTSDMAHVCGLLEGTPLIAGCGDSAASSFGAAVTSPGIIYDVAGTASIFSCSTDSFFPDTKHKTLFCPRSVVEGLWIPLAYISGGGMCLEWFRDITGLDFLRLDRLAGEAHCGDTPYFIPHFSGRACPNNSNLHGSFTGLANSHTKGHMFRSVMESIAFEYSIYFSVLNEANPAIIPSCAYAVGGGSKSAVFNQIKADVLGTKYIPLSNSDTAAYGAAMLAAYGTEHFKDIRDAVHKETDAAVITPDIRNTELYIDKIKTYEKLLKSMELIY